MKYSIQKLSVKHLDVITTSIANALKEDSPHYKPETILSYHRNIYNKKYFLRLLKEKKSAVLGVFYENIFIGLIVLKAEYGGVLKVDWLVVKKEFRNKGAGNFLLEQAEKWALAHRYHYLYLYTENDKNIAYYQKRGFRYIGKHENSWFGEVEHVMEKSLQDKPF